MTVPFLTAPLYGLLFSDMVRVVECHAGVLDSNPGGPKDFSLWNCFSIFPSQRASKQERIFDFFFLFLNHIKHMLLLTQTPPRDGSFEHQNHTLIRKTKIAILKTEFY